MRRVMLAAGSTVALLAGLAAASAADTSGTAAPAAADAGPVVQNSQAMAADDMPKTTMRQQLTDQLTKAGFTDITVMPMSFYIHAKNKQGDPVAMVIGPDGFTEVTDMPMKPAAGGSASKPDASGTAAPKQ